MRAGEKDYSSEELVKTFNRVSEKIIFWGCGNPWEDTEQCIESRIKKALEYRTEQYKKTKRKEDKQAMDKLKNLIKYEFAYKWTIDAWINPHPIYKKKLGIPDDVYEELVRKKEKQESDEGFKVIKEYEKYLRSERLKKKKKAR